MEKQHPQLTPKPRQRSRRGQTSDLIRFAPPPLEGQQQLIFNDEPEEEAKEHE